MTERHTAPSALLAVVAMFAVLYKSVVVAEDAAVTAAFFEKEVVPSWNSVALRCHSHESGEAKGGLVLDSQRWLENGGESGPAIIPGVPEESLLIQAVKYHDEDLQMPPKDKKLPDGEIAPLEKWVTMGAPDPPSRRCQRLKPAKLWRFNQSGATRHRIRWIKAGRAMTSTVSCCQNWRARG